MCHPGQLHYTAGKLFRAKMDLVCYAKKRPVLRNDVELEKLINYQNLNLRALFAVEIFAVLGELKKTE